MDVLIVATSLYDDRFASDWQPDLRYTASFLRGSGIDAGFIYQPTLSCPDAVERCARPAPRILFVEFSEENRRSVLDFISAFKRLHPEVLVAVGGIPATLMQTAFFGEHDAADFIIAGERDATLLELAQRCACRKEFGGVAGLQSKQHRNPPRSLIEDLDCLGSMVHDGLAELLAPIAAEDRVGYLMSSRGCYASCSFCGIPAFFRYSGRDAWRGRSPGAVVAEMCQLADEFGIRRFVFVDDSFIGRVKRARTGLGRSGARFSTAVFRSNTSFAAG